jgi:hypothetical protein
VAEPAEVSAVCQKDHQAVELIDAQKQKLKAEARKYNAEAQLLEEQVRRLRKDKVSSTKRHFGKVPQNCKELVFRFLSAKINLCEQNYGSKVVEVTQSELYQELVDFLLFHKFPWSMSKPRFAKQLVFVGGMTKKESKAGSGVVYKIDYGTVLEYLEGDGSYDSKTTYNSILGIQSILGRAKV